MTKYFPIDTSTMQKSIWNEAMEIAKSNNDEEKIQFISTKFPLRAVEEGNIEKVDSLLNLGLNINSKFGDDEKPLLHFAIENNNRDMIDFLIEKNADIKLTDKYGDTCVHCIAKNGKYQEILQKVLNITGVDILNQENKNQETPLILSFLNPYADEKFTKMLISNQNIHFQNTINQYPIHIAFKFKDYDIHKMTIEWATLLNYQKYKNVKDFSGRTPLDYGLENPSFMKAIEIDTLKFLMIEKIQKLTKDMYLAVEYAKNNKDPNILMFLKSKFDPQWELFEAIVNSGA
jgi:ankyrin repeat protein